MDYPINLLLEHDKVDDYSDYNLDRLYNNPFVDESIVLRLVKEGKKAKGYCFNYALKDYEIDVIEDVLSYLEWEFKQIALEEIQKGDIVVFFDADLLFYENGIGKVKLTEDNIQHVGRIQKVDKDINKIIIRSKWGEDGIFETNLQTLPDSYGNRVVFFRRIKRFSKGF